MWKNFDGTPYSRDGWKAHVLSIPVANFHWVKFCVLHNTASPTLAQWLGFGTTPAQRIKNLQHFYEVSDHWHAGPHGFIDPTHIWGFSDLTLPGVHASCFNHESLGFEMVGDYSKEAFDTGPGAEVRDNAVFALAVVHKHLGIDPNTLHFHKECLRDHHDCPGKNVSKSDMITRVKAQMEKL
jgi:hypothetical protein